jgi:hypothetical protein
MFHITAQYIYYVKSETKNQEGAWQEKSMMAGISTVDFTEGILCEMRVARFNLRCFKDVLKQEFSEHGSIPTLLTPAAI